MRKAEKTRKTSETEISVRLNIDGMEERKINTGIGLLDHMLDLFAYWGHFDLELIVKRGDFNIDIHHTNEDVGIVLGQAFKEALGDKKGINRIGSAKVPMEEVLAEVVIDISGRGLATFRGIQGKDAGQVFACGTTKEGYELKDATHFFEGFAKHLGANLIIKESSPSDDLHTTLEPVFKALGIALDQATQIDPRRKGVPSTKGIID
ncbi:MAG: imidazoleglycerol-phosphate dehydratase [Candidatus Omnitrophota bacterium]|nr:imidazoleglycerol-phosphate dehydratase [Candidatus Omnitrophota bacterium]MBU1929205.1 imidazoleglycerol-phosphate dehydratase [Candidatus Omnitrophota bacterium]MBU2035496.1 imidazoleglycerol-phosphate dehydratase [Candidatus Omnitrophota bacterium]MBU2221254.1 imidazoleglycerol-phosphate dehydratase [Candidatus Omnitrophota bacterium]MBU2258922.1 imidazoleglycerol-phosphate dehydratase [Candidatus Omnitrophota bacterium]